MLIRIVDDDEDLAESLKFLLEPEGWKVVSYLSAEDYLKSDAPSVEGCLLLDIRMPGLSGLELQEKMKERGWEVPIIFLTGHGDVDVAVQAMKFGAYDFLQKPVKAERLIQAISSVASILKEKRDYGASLEYWYKKFQLLTDRERSGVSRPLESRNFRASEYKYQNSAYASTEFLQKIRCSQHFRLSPNRGSV